MSFRTITSCAKCLPQIQEGGRKDKEGKMDWDKAIDESAKEADQQTAETQKELLCTCPMRGVKPDNNCPIHGGAKK